MEEAVEKGMGPETAACRRYERKGGEQVGGDSHLENDLLLYLHMGRWRWWWPGLGLGLVFPSSSMHPIFIPLDVSKWRHTCRTRQPIHPPTNQRLTSSWRVGRLAVISTRLSSTFVRPHSRAPSLFLLLMDTTFSPNPPFSFFFFSPFFVKRKLISIHAIQYCSSLAT